MGTVLATSAHLRPALATEPARRSAAAVDLPCFQLAALAGGCQRQISGALLGTQAQLTLPGVPQPRKQVPQGLSWPALPLWAETGLTNTGISPRGERSTQLQALKYIFQIFYFQCKTI